jgi:chromosome segregation ATPase
MERRVGIPELGRMEAHLKELQAENDKLQARLERLTEAYEQKFLHKRSDLRDARYRNNKLKAGNENLEAELAESARIRFELRTDNAKLQAQLRKRSGLTRVQVNDILRENENLQAVIAEALSSMEYYSPSLGEMWLVQDSDITAMQDAIKEAE